MAHYKEILDAINELKEGFGRLDERTQNIYSLDEKQERHLSDLNGNILELWKQTTSSKTSIKWIIRILAGAGVIGGGVTGLVKWLG